MHVFVTGGTGLIGGRLIARLLQRGDRVTVLSRSADSARKKLGDRCEIVVGDPTQPGPWQDAVVACDAVVHLAGEGIFNQRWSAEFKERMITSRVRSTENIVAALARKPQTDAGRPKTLVNASAIGYYGFRDDGAELSEDSGPGSDFLAQVCVDWEKAAHAAVNAGVRLVIVRIGVVLDPSGGALQKMLPPFRMFVGGPLGSGKQYMSWIHIDDLVGLILYSLDYDAVSGVVNGTAPQPVTNAEFSRALGAVLHRPSFMPTPAFALRAMLGESADIITKGQRVLPRRAQELGFHFSFNRVGEALENLLGRK